MKRILAVVIVILNLIFSVACENNLKRNDMIEYKSGEFYDKNWNETAGTYSAAVIQNEKTALEIAKAVFDGMEKSENMKDYIPISVFYDDKDEIWVVSFAENPKENVLGSDCSIAMQKKDGKVLRIWFGE